MIWLDRYLPLFRVPSGVPSRRPNSRWKGTTFTVIAIAMIRNGIAYVPLAKFSSRSNPQTRLYGYQRKARQSAINRQCNNPLRWDCCKVAHHMKYRRPHATRSISSFTQSRCTLLITQCSADTSHSVNMTVSGYDDPSQSISTSTSSEARSMGTHIAAERLRIACEKKESRKRILDETRVRNLRLKRLLHFNANVSSSSVAAFSVPELYAVKVSVCRQLREELQLSGREKRGRVFIEVGSPGSTTLRGLKQAVHSFFRCLRKCTFVMSASLPEIAENGSLVSPLFEKIGDFKENANSWSVDTDEAVKHTFETAREFAQSRSELQRPSIALHILKDDNGPAMPTPPKYLENLANPSESAHMTMLSFYTFPPNGIEDPEEFGLTIKKLWKPFGALGRVYVAHEGVNAQMAVPSNVLTNFRACCHSIPELHNMESGLNIDPIDLTMEQFQIASETDSKIPLPPFKNLHIRTRHQVVSDGLDKPLNWQNAGYNMPPEEWHQRLQDLKGDCSQSSSASSRSIVLDCRNEYETAVGKFEGAEPLNTKYFRDSWDVLNEKLADKPKNTPIMTYCTGGIRCVKVGAYLTQELGFTNVSRLAGGIVAYDRSINGGQEQGTQSLFKGTNFVFDGRLGRQITDTAIGTCKTCGSKTSLISNCKNDNCHQRMVQCENCRSSFMGACSDACRTRVINSGKLKTVGGGAGNAGVTNCKNSYTTIGDYCTGYSSPTPPLFNEIVENTVAMLAKGCHMLSGTSQGRFLAALSSSSREGRILEIGTFSGYATSWFLEGATNAGEAIQCKRLGNRESGPYVLTLDRDQRALSLAVAHVRVLSAFGSGSDGAREARFIRTGASHILADSMKGSMSFPYKGVATCELMHTSDALATLEEMASGLGPNTDVSPFDVVFIDADKARLLDYTEVFLGNDRLLKKGGLILVDNVLWKGLVLSASEDDTNKVNVEIIDEDKTLAELRKSRRARKLATMMHNFNDAIAKDKRADAYILPIRDGLNMIRKR